MGQPKKSGFKLDQFMVVAFDIKRYPKDQGILEFSINPSGVLDRENKLFTLHLDVKAADNKSFNLSIEALGIFRFKDVPPPGELSDYFHLNAPAIMFPYIRAYISTVTALSGLNAVNLPILNLTGLQSELKNNIKEVSSRPKRKITKTKPS